MSTKLPLKADHVGSLLRTEEIKKARKQWTESEITAEQLKKIEDQEIEKIVQKQIESGLKAITDGEFRRSWWHLDFMWGLGGVEKIEVDHGYQFNAVETRAESARLTGKLSGSNHPFIEHFKFVKQLHRSFEVYI